LIANNNSIFWKRN